MTTLTAVCAFPQVRAHPFFNSIDWITLRTKTPLFVPKRADKADTSYFEDREAFYSMDAESEEVEELIRLTTRREDSGAAAPAGDGTGEDQFLVRRDRVLWW